MEYDVVVIGGGVVGLATALNLLENNPNLKLLLLEKEGKVAAHQSGHNSGVIHSGIYYKPGGLKATHCLRGYELLISFCERHRIPFEICGKLIVATRPAEQAYLHTLFERGQANGLAGLRKLNAGELREYEPYATGVEGILVPQTGIVDFKAVAAAYASCIVERGGEIAFGQRVMGMRQLPASRIVTTAQGASFDARLVINCGGLYSDEIAAMTERDLPLRIIPFRGEYYQLRAEKRYLVRNLIYPVPNPDFPFLGVHFTRAIDGSIEAGPNAVFVSKKEGYVKGQISLREGWRSIVWPGFRRIAMKYWKEGAAELYRSYSKAAFTRSLQQLAPDVVEDDLEPGGAGVRAQACSRNGQLIDDFVIRESERVIHVCNAPSPAATASLAIGETIARRARDRGWL